MLLQPRVDPYSALTTRWTLGITVALLPHQDHNMMPILQVKAGRDREVQELPPAPTSVIQPARFPALRPELLIGGFALPWEKVP